MSHIYIHTYTPTSNQSFCTTHIIFFFWQNLQTLIAFGMHQYIRLQIQILYGFYFTDSTSITNRNDYNINNTFSSLFFFILLFILTQDLQSEIETHRGVYDRLDGTGRKLLGSLTSQEDAVMLQRRLDEMNHRWNHLKSKSIAIRCVFSPFSASKFNEIPFFYLFCLGNEHFCLSGVSKCKV